MYFFSIFLDRYVWKAFDHWSTKHCCCCDDQRTFEWWICSVRAKKKPAKDSFDKNNIDFLCVCIRLFLLRFYFSNAHIRYIRLAHTQSTMKRKIKFSMGSFSFCFYCTLNGWVCVCVCIGVPRMHTFLRMLYEILRIFLCIRSAWCHQNDDWCLKKNIKYHPRAQGVCVCHVTLLSVFLHF